MGNARFSRDDYTSYTATRGISAKSTRDKVFTSRKIPEGLDPSKIKLRESCDSEANPLSTPIIFGLDVTGSMGFVAEAIAKTQLPDLMEAIYTELPVTDPHFMFMGIGDVACDQAPLQVSQFEAGAEPLMEQLREIFIEGCGGGNNTESYNLPWYFAANKTKIDSFEKRGVKGFLFTIGDEMPPTDISARDLTKTFGKGQHPSAGNMQELLATAQQQFRVFHIIAEEGHYAQLNKNKVRERWTQLLGPNAIFLRDHRFLTAVVTATLQIANGADLETVVKNSQAREELEYAFANAIAGINV